MVLKCFLLPGWDLPVEWVPLLFPFLDHTEESLNQEDWEDRLFHVSTPQDLPSSTFAFFPTFRILREDSPRPPRDWGHDQGPPYSIKPLSVVPLPPGPCIRVSDYVLSLESPSIPYNPISRGSKGKGPSSMSLGKLLSLCMPQVLHL